jgi:hypothetical protein
VRPGVSPIGAVAVDIVLDCLIWKRGLRGAMPSELIGRSSRGINGTGGRGHSGVERRCSLGAFRDCGDAGTGDPKSLSSSMGVSGSPGSRFRCSGGNGISVGDAGTGSDILIGVEGAISVEVAAGVVVAFFLPMPKFYLHQKMVVGRACCHAEIQRQVWPLDHWHFH